MSVAPARPLTIAIDGPAGAGKSTAARALARALGYRYFDSGTLYRAVGVAARRRGLDPADGKALAALVAGLRIAVEGERVLLDGDDVTAAIRAPEAGDWASRVAAVPEVRRGLIDRQRDLAAAGGIVMDGRDIGTVVLPDADRKFFVTASLTERARRRQAEHPEEEPAAVRAAIAARDRRDAERAVAPLRAAPDAVVIDTSGLGPAAVLDALLAAVHGRARP